MEKRTIMLYFSHHFVLSLELIFLGLKYLFNQVLFPFHINIVLTFNLHEMKYFWFV